MKIKYPHLCVCLSHTHILKSYHVSLIIWKVFSSFVYASEIFELFCILHFSALHCTNYGKHFIDYFKDILIRLVMLSRLV